MQDGYASEQNTELSDGRTYDNFLAGSGWVVREVFGNFLTQNLQTSQLYFEIRRNVRPHNGGTKVSWGTVAIAANTPTGRSGFGMEERYVLANVNGVSLANGVEYWLAIALIGNRRGRAFVVTTVGQDAGPPGDPNPPPQGLILGRSYFDSPFFGTNYIPIEDVFGYPADFSLGVNGVPEPASMIVLGSALAGFAARRRK